MRTGVAVLGATGIVGQKVIALLEAHPRFCVEDLVSSENNKGRYYEDACTWREPLCPLPDRLRTYTLKAAEDIASPFVVSCLPADIAREIEPILAQSGRMVFSNASSFRMDARVPLVIPEVNRDHLSLIARQSTPGKIITNPNCSAVGVCLALAPLMELGTIVHVSVVTMQSLSGAGYPGVSAFDLVGNTIPHIPEEAVKIEEETKKILGKMDVPADFGLTVHVHRVPVVYGHSATLHVSFLGRVTAEDALSAYRQWNMKSPDLFVLHARKEDPQPLRVLHHSDMRIHIGHLKQGGIPNTIGLVVLSHNLVRGAAGAAIANMEAYQLFSGSERRASHA